MNGRGNTPNRAATPNRSLVSVTSSQQALADSYYSWVTGYLSSSAIKDQESQNPLGNYVATTLANIYLQAMAAMVFVGKANMASAKTVLDNVQAIYDATFNAGPKGLYGHFTVGTNAVDTSTDRWVGNNAWLLLALCHFQRAAVGTADSNRYQTMANGIADWIVALQDIASKQNRYNDGGFYSGYRGATSGTPNALMNYKVTEGVIDCIAALRAHARWYSGAYSSNADQGETFLLTAGSGSSGGLRYAAQSRFYASKTDSASYPAGSPTYDSTHYLDNVLWAGKTVKDINFSTVIAGLAQVDTDCLKTGINPTINGSLSLTGYSDVSTQNRIFTEGYAYQALLYARRCSLEWQASGRLANFASYATTRRTELDKYSLLTISSVAVPGTSGSIQKTNLPDYTAEDTSIGAESVLWYLVATLNINPFIP